MVRWSVCFSVNSTLADTDVFIKLRNALATGDHVLGLLSFLAHIGDRIDADLKSENQHPFSVRCLSTVYLF